MVSKEISRMTSNDLLSTLTAHIEELAQATDEALLSEQMQQYLEMCAQFHHYSPNNVWLIMLFCPHASMVAGFHKWKSMGRFVRKGEKGIPILSPLLVRDTDGIEDEPKKLVGFRVVYVFDVSQTDGNPLPDPPEWKSPEQSKLLTDKLMIYAETLGIAVEIKELEGEIQGISTGGKIYLSPQAGTKTLIHELAHELLHQKSGERMWLGLMELEAESVAYVVAKYFGLDGLASPNYVALHGADAESILEHMERIRNTAVEIVAAIDTVSVGH